MNRALQSARAIATATAIVLGAAQALHGQNAIRATPAPPPAASTEETAPVTPPPPSDPLVADILALRLETPSQLARAIGALLNLDQPAQAKPLLARLVEQAANDKGLAEITQQIDNATLARWARTPELLPEAEKLARRVWQAAEQAAADPGSLDTAIDQRLSGDATARALALTRLRRASSAAAARVVGRMMAAQDDEVGRFIETLVALGAASSGPLRAALESTDPRYRARAARALAELRDREAAIDLVAIALAGEPAEREAASQALVRLDGRVPNTGEAIDRLTRRARILVEGESAAAMALGSVEEWRWNIGTAQPEVRPVSLLARQAREAARLLRAARRLAPQDEALVTRYYQQAFHASAVAGEPAAALSRELTMESERLWLDLLDISLAEHTSEAAIAVLALLGEACDAACLSREAPRPSAIVRALRDPAPRVRWAALETIAFWNPTAPFPGSSLASEAMEFFIHTSGERLAVVVDPRTDEGQRIAGVLTHIGFRAGVLENVRDAFCAAAESADCELVLASSVVECPGVAELLSLLRRDHRTARLPLGIVAGAGQNEFADAIARDDGRTLAVDRPHDAGGMQFIVDRLLAGGQPPEAPQERLARSRRALAMLAKWQQAPDQPFELAGAAQAANWAALESQLSVEALKALSSEASHEAQRRLVDLASHLGRPIESRRAALRALGESIANHGLLLSSRDVLDQYDRYNDSETEEPATQAILASILDLFEAQAPR